MAWESSPPKYLIVGEILRPHGIRGELRVRVLTADRQRLTQLDAVYLGASPADAALEKHSLQRLRFNKNYALLSLEGCGSRDEADALRGKMVMMDSAQATPLAEGEYYLSQLIGMRVAAAGTVIGTVKETLETGANDVYIVEGGRYGEVLIPAHAETIQNIDFAARVIHMTLPEGLLPPD